MFPSSVDRKVVLPRGEGSETISSLSEIIACARIKVLVAVVNPMDEKLTQCNFHSLRISKDFSVDRGTGRQ